MSVTIKGIPQLHKRLNAIDHAIGKDLLRAIQVDATRYAKQAAPVKTGNLRRTIRPGSLTDAYAIVRADAGYAAYVEFGTRPHDIKPRNARVLAWPAAGQARLSGAPRRGADMIFARRVHHPGTKPKPFLVPAAKQAVEENIGAQVVVRSWNEAA